MHSYMWRETSARLAQSVCAVTHSYVCAMTHALMHVERQVLHSYVRDDSFVCVCHDSCTYVYGETSARLIRSVCAVTHSHVLVMTHSYVCHDSFVGVRHDSFMCVP